MIVSNSFLPLPPAHSELLSICINFKVKWYDTVVGMPNSYKATDATDKLLSQIEELEFEEQMSVLRTIVGDMGYTDIKPIETQAETGKTASL